MKLVLPLATLIAFLASCLVAASGLAKPSTPASIAQGGRPAIVSDLAGHLHLAYERGREGAYHIYYQQSSDQGSTWSQPVDVSPEQGNAQYGEIVAGKGNSVDVVFNGSEGGTARDKPSICFARSADGGTTFTRARTIFDGACKTSGPSMAMAPDGGLHLVYCQQNGGGTDRLIYYSHSADNGATWSERQLLSTDRRTEAAGLSSQPTIAVSEDGVVHVSWLEFEKDKDVPDVFYNQLENGVWSKRIDVSHSPRISQQPVVAAGKGKKVFVTWLDNSKKETAPDIWCSVNKHEVGFSPAFNISDTPGVSGDPAMTADKRGRVVIVWSDTTSGVTKPDIYGRISLDSLSDYSNLIDFSNTDGRSKRPSVAITGDRAVVVWEEITAAGSEILSKFHSLIGVATGPTPLVDQEIHGASSNSR